MQREPLPNWSFSLRSFVLPVSCFVLQASEALLMSFRFIPKDPFFNSSYTQAFIMLILLAALWIFVAPSKFGICWRAYFLGCLMNVGLTLTAYSDTYQSFGLYLAAVSFFHWSEFMMQAVYNPKTTTVSSYMLYHSHAYVAAIAASLMEYWLEIYLFPTMKPAYFISNVGLTIVLCGEILRKISMITAKSNFNHHIQYDKANDHELVTHGVYSRFRHPSYVGWFWWSIGTQILLANPVCIVLFTLASWQFFSERIYHEELTLVNFFGEKYVDYQKKVGTGLPFVTGYTRPEITKLPEPNKRD